MNDVIDALAEWRENRITRGQLLRRLLEFENWMTPIHEDRGDPFARFALSRAKLIRSAEGKAQIFLLSCGDTTEAVQNAHAEEGGMGFSNPTGWEIFSVALDGIDAVVIDPGAPHEFVIDSAEFSEIKPLADAVAIEEVWQRLRAGEEEEDDVARAARYPGYHIAVVRREEGWLLIHVPHDDGGRFVPVFTHDDTLALALDEFRENFATHDLKTVRIGGVQLFPALAKEKADGIVFNYQGPGEPIAFRLDVTDIMLAELATDNSQSAEVPVMTLKDPAEPQRPPEAPPVSCGLDELHQWFAGLRVADADVTKYAVGIVRKHFATAGVDVRPELTNASDWAGFAFYLSMMLGPIIDKEPKANWVKALLAELVDFSLANPSGTPAARLAQLLAQFIQWDLERRDKFRALLPPKADPALDLIAQWEADERQRREEGYY